MKLDDVDLNRLVPEFMRDDACIKALNATLEPVIKELAKTMRKLPMWDNLEALTEEELDELAYEYNIPWYNKAYSKVKKVAVLKSNVQLMKRLGTPHTFKTILEDIFGGCELQEAGIDYDGEPHHIQIMVANGENLDKVSYDRLNYIISKVKRASTWLDRVASTYQADMFETMLLRHNEERHDNISMDINGFINYELK